MKMITAPKFIKGHGCFYDSLANLLILLDDEKTAKKVLENSRNYYLKTGRDGICMGTQTRAVRELTEGVYTGRSIMLPLTQEAVEQIKYLWGSKARHVLNMIEEEFKLGNLVAPNDEDCAYAPRLVFFNGKMIKKEDGTLERITNGVGHVILQAEEDIFIDKGRIINYNLDDLAIVALMSVERVR